MKTLTLLFCLVLFCQLAQAEAPASPPYPPNYPPPPPEHGGACQVNYPGHVDLGGRRCVNQNAYSVTYNGYFHSDAPCVSDINQAMNVVRNEYACRRPSYHGYCALVSPGQLDRRNSRCVNQAAWGVAYNGFFFSTTPCFQSATAAIQSMENTWACTTPPQSGRCSLVNPGEPDRSNRRCVSQGAWGLTYNGYFISDAPCFQSVDEAVRSMLSNPACR